MRHSGIPWLLVAGLVGCGSGPSAPANGDADREFRDLPADNVIFQLEHYVTTNGLRRALVRGDSAFVFEDSAKVHLRRPRVTVFDAQGQENAQVTGARGVLDTRTQGMIVRGNVVLTTRLESREIRTSELHYDPVAGRIWSDSATTMQEAGTNIRGTGFEADAEMKNVKVRRPTGRFEGLRIEF